MVEIITTGGTIDTEVNKKGNYILERTLVPEMLKQARVEEDIKVKRLLRDGSSGFSHKERNKILNACKNSKEKKIIITHGTDSIAKTAKFLGEKIKDKTIVLTGSFVPYSQKNSDALFNLGFSLASVKTLEKGVYIGINGKIFDWKNVKKNFSEYRFEEEINIQELAKKYKVPLVGYSKIETCIVTQICNEGTLFQMASISKPVTAFCVMRLADKGKLSLNADVNNYLKDWKVRDKDGKQVKVTLKQLLSHTAGISCLGFGGYNEEQKFPSLKQVLEGKDPANSEKIYCKYKRGEYNHSGGGYVVLRKILEDKFGKSFNKIMREEVLRPLGMKKSTFGLPGGNDFARGHLNGKSIGYHMFPEKPAAALWSTAEEFSKFLIEVQEAYDGESELLSKKTARKMLRPVIEAEGNYMALGFFITKDKRKFFHGGHNPGFRSKFMADFKGDGVVVLSNEEKSLDFINKAIKVSL